MFLKKALKILRLCFDFRELNKTTIRDHYPIPLIDQLELLKDKKYFTSLDLNNGFYHVRVAESSLKYTSFITPLGQYEYLKMPFGLANAPSVFQSFVNTIFKDRIRQNKLLIYLDDILIAETVAEHLTILKVFHLITQNLLEIRKDTCLFMETEIIYLGYLIDADGIRPNLSNVQAVNNFPIPDSIKKVHSFIGWVISGGSYHYSRLSQNLSMTC